MSPLPDCAKQFAAELALLGFLAADHAPGGAQDRGTHAAEDVRNVLHAAELTKARLTFTADAANSRIGVVVILQVNAQHAWNGAGHREVSDVAFCFHHFCNLALDARAWKFKGGQPCLDRVANAQ